MMQAPDYAPHLLSRDPTADWESRSATAMLPGTAQAHRLASSNGKTRSPVAGHATGLRPCPSCGGVRKSLLGRSHRNEARTCLAFHPAIECEEMPDKEQVLVVLFGG